ncbi:mannose-specific lectin-like [Dendrobium catenatum]|uniref:Mannose-specific lectin n=1 Tax=Dendrobium catenatum TaxID=906689 RepID=A0A2I0WN83_9ASPA|nr:mannose-specific lectin-like [Dendrobium catenatum]PKU77101.1 Mannose-specific lectin [Dendrobium catenatum]
MGANLIFFRYVFLFLVARFLVTEAAEYNHLLVGDTLKIGEKLTEGNYNLIMQPDCNLVLYQENPNETVWSSKTAGQGNMCAATLKTDGNFVITDKNGTVVGLTATNNTGSFYVFVLQRNRNVVLYSKAIWSSVTNIDDQSSGSNNQAIEWRWLKGLMLLVACICAILF